LRKKSFYVPKLPDVSVVLRAGYRLRKCSPKAEEHVDGATKSNKIDLLTYVTVKPWSLAHYTHPKFLRQLRADGKPVQ
jgi:hypothetical protein